MVFIFLPFNGSFLLLLPQAMDLLFKATKTPLNILWEGEEKGKKEIQYTL